VDNLAVFLSAFTSKMSARLKEASQTRDFCVARNATHRAARPDPSLRKKRLLRMTTNHV
jgi:ribosomal protein S12